MIRKLPLIAAALAGTVFAGAAHAPAAAISDATLAALDPTRLGRAACGGGDFDQTLARRLQLAQDYADAQPTGRGAMPLFGQIYDSKVPATGLSGDARRFFDQGIMLAYGFNHAASIRSFQAARRLAPDCVMCWWGEALANGPNINAGMDTDQNRAALAALEKARARLDSVSALERELVEAQLLRYSAGDGGDRAALDAAYADAMLDIARRHPDNDDVAILAAEAAMNTSPWNYWDERKQPIGRIGPAIALVEKTIGRNPDHPQAPHLYIHLMENSADPSRAEAAADGLVRTAPAGVGHLIHMPAHIYYRIGRYADSMRANIDAARADEDYLARMGDDGLYRYGYYPHNVHFLLTSAQMVGDMNRVASETARLTRILDVETAKALPWVQAIHAAPFFALAQYASSDAILTLSGEETGLAYVDATRHYARAIAFAERGDKAAFGKEIAAMERIAGEEPAQAMIASGFPAPDIIKLASLVARGRMAHWQGDTQKAVDYFEQAEAIEPTIPYTEPPYWYYPVAQSRGAALYSAGRYVDARQAFRKALLQAPNDGWALYGLKLTEQKLGNRLEARATDAALRRVWRGDTDWLKMKRL